MIAAGSRVGTGIGGVMHGEDGAVLGRHAQDVAEPVELLGLQRAVVVLGHARVERHDPQPAHVVDPVLRPVVVGAEESLRVRRALVVVADHPDHLGAQVRGHRLDELPQPRVGVRLCLVREVAGEHQRLRHRVEPAEPIQGEPQPGLGLDDAVLLDAVGEQVDVAEVGDVNRGRGIGRTARADASAERARPNTGTAGRRTLRACSNSSRPGSSSLPAS